MCCLVSSRAFRRYPICCHCAGVRKITHIDAHCSHGTKITSTTCHTTTRTQPRTMSDGICSDDEKYGGFGAAMANSVAAYSAAPARVVAAVTAARAPGGTKKSLPVTAAERVWKTKCPYQRHQKKSSMPAPAPQASAPAEATAPVPPLFTTDKAMVQAPAEKKSPPRLCCCALCGAHALLFVWRAYPSKWYCRRDHRD